MLPQATAKFLFVVSASVQAQVRLTRHNDFFTIFDIAEKNLITSPLLPTVTF
jgi:hypothetical protein